jgi:4-amino-4-deoxy-L-arabinose transferase-like glycosyltransferase
VTGDGTRTPLATTLAIGGGIGLAKLAATAPFMGRYGWDRDELYFLAAARHPALGYVDFPPVTAWIGWLVVHTAGASLVALRMTGQLAGLAAVVLVALMARELGGGRGAQALAAGAWALTPFALGAGTIFHPTQFDAAMWPAVLYVALRIVVRPEPRLWPLLGILAGIGLETKYTIVVLLACMAAGLAATSGRRLYRTSGPWIAAGIAALLMVPNLVWQAANGWPSVAFYPSQQAKTASDASPAEFVLQSIGFLGAAWVLVAVGLVMLWRRPALRPFVIAPVLATGIFLVERGRSYYPLPADGMALAAGAAAAAGWLGRARLRGRVAAAAAVALQMLVLWFAAPLVVPVRSVEWVVSSGTWDTSFYGDELGWPAFVAQTARAWDALPSAFRTDGALVAQNYGEAGALARTGRAQGLPEPLSGHLSWQFWRPADLPQRHLLAVGFDPDDLGRLCSRWRPVGRIRIPWPIDNDEQGRLLAACTLRAPLGELWHSRIASDTL